MKRRRLLATVGAASASVAGCLGADMPQDAAVRAVQESPGADASVVAYDDLPQAEQRIARTAAEEGLYHACPELPEALWSFESRFTDPENAYLRYQGTSYAVWMRIQDVIPARTASRPENVPSCGFL